MIALCFRRRRAFVGFLAAGTVGVLGIGLAVLLSIGSAGHIDFRTLYLFSWLSFGHVPLVLIGSATALWQTKRPFALVFAGLAVCTLGIGADAFLVEPYRLQVDTYTVASPKVPQPTRIVVIADLQTDVVGPYEREALRRAMEQKPDLILLAGDYLQQNPLTPELVQEFRSLLREVGLSAPLGVYAVQGDVEHPDWPELFRDLPVTVMETTATRKDHWFAITGLTIGESHLAGLGGLNPPIPGTDEFHIVLAHAPDFALAFVPADLLVSGHTHGGQVQLPFIGPLITFSHVPRAWAAGGLTKLEGDRTLIVSRGIGMERAAAPRLRFLCPPQLVVIDLKPA
jgi:predicted MPP superfamily phosphohydrolase